MTRLLIVGLALMAADLTATLLGWRAFGPIDANPLVAAGVESGNAMPVLLWSFAAQAVLLVGACWLAVRWRGRWRLSPWLILGTVHAVGAWTWVMVAIPQISTAAFTVLYWVSIPGFWLLLERPARRWVRQMDKQSALDPGNENPREVPTV